MTTFLKFIMNDNKWDIKMFGKEEYLENVLKSTSFWVQQEYHILSNRTQQRKNYTWTQRRNCRDDSVQEVLKTTNEEDLSKVDK